jgi:phosphatidylserine/phosphatidylglycerophosphate/cardiolipin synthase-like enzyme
LKKSGINVIYDKSVHAKLIVIDNEVAVISSMNFSLTSSGGKSWEAGIVSIEENVINSIIDSIRTLSD